MQMEFEAHNHRPICISSNSSHTSTFQFHRGWENILHIHKCNTSAPTNARPINGANTHPTTATHQSTACSQALWEWQTLP